MIIFLARRDGGMPPEWQSRYSEIALRQETDFAWYGRPVDNPACPELTLPKFAWKEVGYRCRLCDEIVDLIGRCDIEYVYLCEECFDRAGLEQAEHLLHDEHIDGGHPEKVDDCPICKVL